MKTTINKYFKVKSYAWNEYPISKLDILLNFEREIDRWKNIMGYDDKKASEMKLDVHDMINNEEINENTPANKEFVENLLKKYNKSNEESIKTLSNEQLYIKYQEAKANFRNAIEGTQEEIEADRIFTELSQEVENREDFDWLSFKLEELNQATTKTTKPNNTVKQVKTFVKSFVIATIVLLTTSNPVMAQDVNATVINSDKYFIQAEYNNKVYNFERAIEDHEQWNKGDRIILDLESKDVHEALNGEYKASVVATYPEQNNLVVIKIDNNLYSFYADNDS